MLYRRRRSPLVPLNRRQIELRLLLFALSVVAFGLTLTFFGKMSATQPLSTNSLDINTASRQQFQTFLKIPRSVARQIVVYRSSLPGGAFPSVYRLRRTNLAQSWYVDRNWALMYVRTPQQCAQTCFGWLTAYVCLSLVIHSVLRNRAAAADPYLYPICLLLSGFGLMTAFTVHDPLRDTFAFATQSAGVVLFGAAALLLPLTDFARKLPLRRYTYAYAVASVVLLATLFVFGRGPAGTHIQLFGFEPIEIIKVLLIFFIAAYLADRRIMLEARVARTFRLSVVQDLLPLAAIYVFALSMFGAVKDLGPAVLLFGSFVTMLYLVSGLPIYPILGALLLLLAAFAGDRFGIGFFKTRVEMWLHPWSNTDRLGGQLAEGLWGLSTGGLFGSGPGLGGSYYVPRSGSDMAFTTIGEEHGLVGALCVLLLYVFLVFRGFVVARRAASEFDRLIAAGISVLFGLQAAVICGGATGLIPLTGITLPFVSYGTSSLVMNFFCIGILLNISSHPPAEEGPPQLFVRASRQVALGISTFLLVFVGVFRLFWIMAIDDVQTAVRGLLIPDADGIYRNHRNPRLLAYASSIPRGSIRDRNGALLAADSPGDFGCPYLDDGPLRIYPFGPVAADLLLAVEQQSGPKNPLGSDSALRGYSSLHDLLPLYRDKDCSDGPLVTGQDIHLTIDIRLQQAAQHALNDAARRYGDGCGAIIVLDPRTGALLADATEPTFDPNTLTQSSWKALHMAESRQQSLMNRGLSGLYPPGSVFKLVTATAAFKTNKSSRKFLCRHKLPQITWQYGGVGYTRRGIVDDEDFAPHGTTDLAKALRVSCNVYFAQLGAAIGAPALYATTQQYKLKNCPSPDALGADLPDCAYGQGADEVTPFQMAGVVQTISNGGVYEPAQYFARAAPSPPVRVLSLSDADSLCQMMKTVVTGGTARGDFEGLSVAGKTGSAQTAEGKSDSWFVGFSPYRHTKIAFACIVEHAGQGRGAAASVCKAIVQAIAR